MSEKRKESDGRISRPLLVVIRVLMVGASAIAGYLAWTSLSGSAVAGCGPESSCDKVLHSRWAYWLGVPVSVPALVVYMAVLFLSFRLGKQSPAAEQRKMWPWLLMGAVLILGGAIWFIGLQVAAIHSLCAFCMTAHGLGLAAAVLIFINAPIRPPPEKPWQLEKQVFIPRAVARDFILAAVGALAVLAIGQAAHQKKMFATQSVTDVVQSPASNAIVSSNRALLSNSNLLVQPKPAVTQEVVQPAVPAVTQQVVQPAPPPATQEVAQMFVPQPMKTNRFGGNVIDHRFEVYLGMFQFDLREVPLIGSPEAPYAMLSLFDYTCHHCRLMHPNLIQAHRTFGDKLAIVNLPMPLDGACNYTVKRTPRVHTNACAFAHLGLAVWRADKTKHAAFDEFVFLGENPPPLGEAVQKARELVGPAAYDKAVRDPWIREQMNRSISIYATNYFHVRNGSMPQLMIHTNLTTGTLQGPGDLLGILDRQLGLRVRQ